MIIQGITLTNTSVYDNSFNSNGALLYIDIGNPASYSGSGTTFTDLSSNSNNGTSAGSPTYTNGYRGYLSFNGAGNQYIATATAKYNKTYTGKTVFIAARLASAGISIGTYRCLFGTASGTRNFNTYLYSPSAGVYQIHYSAGSGGGMSNNIPLTVNQWFTIAVTHSLDGTVTYYFNGQPVGTNTGVTFTQWVSNGNENIGVGDNYWLGDIAVCAAYGRALSSDEILQGHNSFDGRFGVSQSLVTAGLTYHLDIGVPASYSGSGSTVNDLAGLGASTLYNTPTYTGDYLTFNGSTQYLQTTNLISKFTSPSNLNLTLEIWVYAASDNGVIIDELGQTAISPAAGWRDSNMEIVSGSAKMALWNGATTNITTAGTFSRSQWQHCVLTYDGTTLRTYINGIAGATSTFARHVPWIDGGAGSTNLYYGLFNGDTTNQGDGSYLAGNLGQFRVYTRALSASEVVQNYQASKPRYGL